MTTLPLLSAHLLLPLYAVTVLVALGVVFLLRRSWRPFAIALVAGALAGAAVVSWLFGDVLDVLGIAPTWVDGSGPGWSARSSGSPSSGSSEPGPGRAGGSSSGCSPWCSCRSRSCPAPLAINRDARTVPDGRGRLASRTCRRSDCPTTPRRGRGRSTPPTGTPRPTCRSTAATDRSASPGCLALPGPPGDRVPAPGRARRPRPGAAGRRDAVRAGPRCGSREHHRGRPDGRAARPDRGAAPRAGPDRRHARPARGGVEQPDVPGRPARQQARPT